MAKETKKEVAAVTSNDPEVQKIDEAIRANVAAAEGDTSGLTAEQKKEAEDLKDQQAVDQAAADTVEHLGDGPTEEDQEREEKARERASKKKLGIALRIERIEQHLGIKD